ncbi:unnamed protein product [Rhizophagus irregularis]|nr:unnamed protein product [Rhizophagus irregularis]
MISNYSFCIDTSNTYLRNCELCCDKRENIICPVSYLNSFTWIEFTTTFPVLYLPWWDTHNQCIVCDSELEFKSNCQKWCSNCFIIYTGCRYCLTTNIIFGITEISQCMKCKRLTLIDINMSPDVENIREHFLKLNTRNFNQIVNYVNNINENSNLLKIYSFIKKLNYFPLNVLYSHIANLAGNNENSLHLTIPIMFIPFNNNENQCYCCKKIYSETPLFKQKYCKECLQWYIKYATSNTDNIKTAIGNLDAYVCTTDTLFVILNMNQEIQILAFKGESTLVKNHIPILYLPWWDAYNQCIVCNSDNSKLEFKSNCQKWCSNCFIIYTGCRYCLTTNIIFGITEKSQCMKCKRLTIIDTNMLPDVENIRGYFLKLNTHNFNQVANYQEIMKILYTIMFIPFDNNENQCYCCKKFYSKTPLFKQKYCKDCLQWYIKYATSNTDSIKTTIGNLDACVGTIKTNCNTKKSKYKLRNSDFCIQEWWFCLTTNIIFGYYINQSQCKRCKIIEKIASIDTIVVGNISGNSNIDEFFNFTKANQVYDYVNNIDKNSNPLNIYKNNYLKIDWVPYSQITNLVEIAEGGYGKIYKASINGNIVAVKEFLNSQDPSKYFLNEIKLLYQCYDNKFEYIIKCHGITKNPMTNKFMFIMKYANGGDLHNYLQENFTKITWKKKMHILLRILDGLQAIHEKDFIHRDFHSGNILVEIIENESYKFDQYLIEDLGLSQPANNTLLSNEIYGVIPYIAPEIFKGVSFSKSSDIYSMGMIMWELTTGCKPFANIEHDTDLIYKIIDGERPKITDDTPEDFANLMKKCWNSNPNKRPSAKQVCERFDLWLNKEKDPDQFNQAEEIRLELLKSKSIGPESSRKHSKAIYTSRSLSSFISKFSSTNSMNSLEQKYLTKEYELNINDIQSPSRDFIIRNSNIQQVTYTSKPLSQLISEMNLSGKRYIEDETQLMKLIESTLKLVPKTTKNLNLSKIHLV